MRGFSENGALGFCGRRALKKMIALVVCDLRGWLLAELGGHMQTGRAAVYRETGGGTVENEDGEDDEKNNTFSILMLDGALG